MYTTLVSFYSGSLNKRAARSTCLDCFFLKIIRLNKKLNVLYVVCVCVCVKRITFYLYFFEFVLSHRMNRATVAVVSRMSCRECWQCRIQI